MFKDISRVEFNNGIRFYEKDILFGEYLYIEDVVVDFTVDYYTPGFGLILFGEQTDLNTGRNDMLMFKLGYRDFNIIHEKFGQRRTYLSVATDIRPIQKDLRINFTKQGNFVEFIADDDKLCSTTLPESPSKFYLGFYSNKDNILKNLQVKTRIPLEWNINMHNTNGGKIYFFKDGFEINNCANPAELAQQKIKLSPGIYYFDCQKELIDNENDIQCYVFSSTDTRLIDSEKNILNSDNSIVINEEQEVDLKFVGTKGIIKNIAIKKHVDDPYVSTSLYFQNFGGSFIRIQDLNKIDYIEWTGAIYQAVENSAIISTSGTTIKPADAEIKLEQAYKYELRNEPEMLVLYITGEETKAYPLFTKANESVELFKNMNAIIDELIVHYKDGRIFNVILQKTNKVFIPANITSPIIVTNANNISFDLSSSYRIYEQDGVDLFLFTNWERETFESRSRVTLTNPIGEISGGIRVYGILKDSKVYPENLYRISNKDLDNIDLYAEKYIRLNDNEYSIDLKNNAIIIDDHERFAEIVVDYLKENSYCINYNSDYKSYEIDIATSEERFFITYDYSINENNVSFMNQYKILDIVPDSNKFICLA